VYIVKKMPEAAVAALEGAFDPVHLPAGFERLDRADISHYPWDANGYRPEACAWMGWNARGLYVLMASFEPIIRSEVHVTGGPVCRDSCLECFLMPAPGLTRAYINIEATPAATIHIGIGEGRHGREVYKELPDGFTACASRHAGGWWAVSCTIPAGLLRERFGAKLEPGAKMRGNFYKCGDLTAFPHFGMWHAYDLPAPDFHRPDMFGDLILE
jgi:hypothetical protein